MNAAQVPPEWQLDGFTLCFGRCAAGLDSSSAAPATVVSCPPSVPLRALTPAATERLHHTANALTLAAPLPPTAASAPAAATARHRRPQLLCALRARAPLSADAAAAVRRDFASPAAFADAVRAVRAQLSLAGVLATAAALGPCEPFADAVLCAALPILVHWVRACGG